MPRISQAKKDKISEQIIHHLFSTSPEAVFTSHISKEIARDEEFIKSLLLNLKQKGLVTEIKKSQKGLEYSKRQRWRLSNQAYEAYKKHQNNPNTQVNNNNIYIPEDLE